MKVFNLKVHMPHAGWQNQGIFQDRSFAQAAGEATVLWVYGRVDVTLFDVETWILDHCMDEIWDNYEDYLADLGKGPGTEGKR